MITKLSVSNYALIDAVEIEPAAGMTILTGETGAGKSILLGALALSTGARADLSALRDKSRKCIVELTVSLDGMDLEDFFTENDLDYDPLTVIRREILPSGKSRAFVNDTPVLLDTLSALSAHLIDVHSQHQSLSLSRGEYRTALTDRYAQDVVQLTRYREAYRKHCELRRQLDLLDQRRAESARAEDYNRYLLDELDKAALNDPDEQQELENLVARLSHSQQVAADLFAVGQHMDDEQAGILSHLSQAVALLRRADPYLPAGDDLAARAESTLIELKDIAARVSDLAGDTPDDPAALERASQRLDALYTLERKHNAADIPALQAIRESLRSQVSSLERIERRIDELQAELSAAGKDLADAARALSEVREKAAGELSSRITDTVRTLGMPHAVFRVEVVSGRTYGPDGADAVRFLFSANLGQQPCEVEKVASGGELSRVMLAVKDALARRAKLPSILFDEIDTGVSGDIADRMGAIMQGMAENMQVVAITHLPQIASRGEKQYRVFKEETDGTTYSRIALLTPEQRVEELARMISGADVTRSALDHARQLLDRRGHSPVLNDTMS